MCLGQSRALRLPSGYPALWLTPVVFLISMAWFLLAVPCGAAARRPNVIVFLADDAGWGDFSRNGNQTVRTPNIDSIAREGVTLENFYVCPVCAPTRAEFLTGRYHPRGGVSGVSTARERLDLDEKTVADAFSAAGYSTGVFGKWHNGSQWPYHPMARGFGEFFGHSSGHWGEYFDPPLEHNGKMVREKGYIADICTDKALDFIERNQTKPFFCYIPFTTPHSPWAAPPDDWARFKDLPVKQAATQSNREKAEETRCALAMMENQDRNVGRVLDKLRDLNLHDDTIVIYFSDNGPNSHRWNGGLKGIKGSTDEGGVRSAFFIRWPGLLPADRKVPQIAGAIDLLPTLLTLAGLPPPGPLPLDGRDLSPLLKNPSNPWPDRRIFSTWGGRVSVRNQQYRLDAEGDLFDMLADPGQTRPINSQNPAMATELAGAIRSWRQEMFRKPADKNPADRPKSSDKESDARPFTVGYPEFPVTMLPARDGNARGGIKRSASAPNCSYFVNWTNTKDQIDWHIEVQTSGTYEATIDYTCPMTDVGSTVELAFAGNSVTGVVSPGWDPPLYTNQDTLPRPAMESRMKEFRTLSLGRITLPKATGLLTLRALRIPGHSVMDVRRVTLTLIK